MEAYSRVHEGIDHCYCWLKREAREAFPVLGSEFRSARWSAEAERSRSQLARIGEPPSPRITAHGPQDQPGAPYP
ncbi:hypothetical protein NDU88_010987 [Pleurodeles waltl]|uniref:Uncharacterized protein n=1 Tax=Pleurodeles waltl TaxID=8319 RepID=A0AAV7QXI6_PLEWA|nr:hypothetical protein NDU88_010987 [Pleurodeles waltl]